MKAVILAGGKGTRLAPFTYVLPKPLMPIGDRAILEVLLKQISRTGIKRVTLAVGYLASLIQAFFGDGSQYGLEIDYAYEETPLGTAGPLAFVPGITKTFLVSNGDVLTLLDFADFLRFHQEQGAICTIAMHQRQEKINLGVIEQNNGDLRVTGYVEKPTLNYKVSMGIYIFEPRVLDYIPRGQYLDFPDLVHKLLDAGEKVVGYPYDGYWRDLGNPEDFNQACADYESMRSQFWGE